MGPLSRTAAAINSHKQNSGRSLSTAAAFLVVLAMLAQPVFAQSSALVLPDGTNFTVESTNHGIVAKPAAGSTQPGGIKASKADTNLRAAALGASQTFLTRGLSIRKAIATLSLLSPSHPLRSKGLDSAAPAVKAICCWSNGNPGRKSWPFETTCSSKAA